MWTVNARNGYSLIYLASMYLSVLKFIHALCIRNCHLWNNMQYAYNEVFIVHFGLYPILVSVRHFLMCVIFIVLRLCFVSHYQYGWRIADTHAVHKYPSPSTWMLCLCIWFKESIQINAIECTISFYLYQVKLNHCERIKCMEIQIKSKHPLERSERAIKGNSRMVSKIRPNGCVDSKKKKSRWHQTKNNTKYI